ncbi:pituitary tumor-transforming gene 1 protein-interacting protein [Nematostella vectensis]|uniref:pituitary tumor-transforming gene 1 protein-interacting protein n=1 Tax=Nematostella vectensis TaxID=45351 RepID=UPI0020777355|nr:pituitary tumor-transforming gene 1 protein-interacting protein [Nematostella vectensis]
MGRGLPSARASKTSQSTHHDDEAKSSAPLHKPPPFMATISGTLAYLAITVLFLSHNSLAQAGSECHKQEECEGCTQSYGCYWCVTNSKCMQWPGVGNPDVDSCEEYHRSEIHCEDITKNAKSGLVIVGLVLLLLCVVGLTTTVCVANEWHFKIYSWLPTEDKLTPSEKRRERKKKHKEEQREKMEKFKEKYGLKGPTSIP